MTTVYRPNVASKTFSACAATQTSLMNLASLPHFAATLPKIISPSRFHDPTSLSCVKNSRTKTKRSSKTSSADLACQSIGIISTQQSKTAVVARVSARSCATWLAVRRTHKKHQLCGMSISKLPSRKPNSKIVSVQAHTTTWLSLVATVKVMLSSTPHDQFCWPHVWHSLHIRMTIATNHFSARLFALRCTELKFPCLHIHLHKLIRAPALQ
ncbi:unannotated protein [freshwater metagenome]|uniref:Unannotated protein n=1 Tax=freshwater metagenome TaxID=449393 RepID=A0A6J6S4P1_9ZZZZ